MAHGAPDYSNVRKEAYIHRLDDMAELANRLTDDLSLDRRGDVLFVENWQYGLNRWQQFPLGTGASVDLSNDNFVSRGVSLLLTGGSDAQRNVTVRYYLPYVEITKNGFEVRVLEDTNVEQIRLQIQLVNDGDYSYGAAVWDIDAKTIQIVDDTGTWITVHSGFDNPYSVKTFSIFKLVIDYENSAYVRLIFNNEIIDLSSYSLYSGTTSTADNMHVLLQVKSKETVNGTAYFDNMIITGNEP